MEQLQPFIDSIDEALSRFKEEGKSSFVSSSFQTHSLPLLHIISRYHPDIPVYFLNTGFHFPETMAFRHVIAESFGLKIIDVSSPVSKLGQRDSQGRFFFVRNTDHCCYLNKVLPMEPVIEQHDIWINGVRRDQTKFRSTLPELQAMGNDKYRYHPMLDWTSKMIWEYRQTFDLPAHPLEEKGYLSIGCMPCTRSFEESNGERGGRWAGQSKDECGIQTAFTDQAKTTT